MAYQALYRTYRPQLFRDVVGQDVVVKTLQNSIANHKISHAYLFCGPRGTGKTTIARIFAKALNCNNLEMNEPCNKCQSCLEISDTISPDVVEIDAASNNGVDEIRDIRDKVKFLPSGTKYRIYIIDEVHMLSQGAFNALLKTLEEPPHHVIFILATTEPQKLPATIISRCQRFDFKSLTVKEIANKLRVVCGQEEVEITEEAISAISEAAEGALRDALSILDMAISYANFKVTIEEVNLVTGNLNYDKLIELANHFYSRDINGALECVDDLINRGKEVTKLIGSLLQFYRDMLLFKSVDSTSYTKYIFGKEEFKKLAEETTMEQIFYYIEVLSDAQVKVKYSQTARIYLEVSLIKLISANENDFNYIERLNKIEESLKNRVFTEESVSDTSSSNDKIDVLELKLNRVIGELSKLELHKMNERIDELSSQVVSSTHNDMKGEISGIKEQLLILKANYESLLNRVGEGVSNEKVEGVTNAQEYKDLKDDVDKLKIKITDVENKEYLGKEAFNEIKEVKKKVSDLEKQTYKLLSEELANKGTKKKKKVVEQIVLFNDDLTPIEDLTSPRVEVDFADLGVEPKEEKKIISTEKKNIEVVQENKENVKPAYTQENLFAKEREKLVSEIKDDVIGNKLLDNKVEEENSYKSSIYDVKRIEKILHSSRTPEARNDSKRIQGLWGNLEKGISTEFYGYIDTLKEGNVVAVGDKEFIISFPTALLCNQVMRNDFRKIALRIIADHLHEPYDYIALPENIWKSKRQEYVEQYNMGTKYPKLTQFDTSELKVIKEIENYKNSNEKVIAKSVDFFGDDIVKID